MKKSRQFGNRWLAGLGLCAALSATGCQVDVGGQTLPSPWWLSDDVQYFSPGAEFKLQREADAMRAAEYEQALIEGTARPGAGGENIPPPEPGDDQGP